MNSKKGLYICIIIIHKTKNKIMKHTNTQTQTTTEGIFNLLFLLSLPSGIVAYCIIFL